MNKKSFKIANIYADSLANHSAISIKCNIWCAWSISEVLGELHSIRDIQLETLNKIYITCRCCSYKAVVKTSHMLSACRLPNRGRVLRLNWCTEYIQCSVQLAVPAVHAPLQQLSYPFLSIFNKSASFHLILPPMQKKFFFEQATLTARADETLKNAHIWQGCLAIKWLPGYCNTQNMFVSSLIHQVS